MRPITLSAATRPLAVDAIYSAPDGMLMWLAERKRSSAQNAKFHATCGDVAKCAEFGGKRITAQQWKTLFISGHAIATGLGAEIVDGLEGEMVNIRESSASMSSSRMSSVIEYQEAWIYQKGILLPAYDRDGQ